MDVYNKVIEGFDFFVRLYSECGKISMSYNDGKITYDHPEFGVLLVEEV